MRIYVDEAGTHDSAWLVIGVLFVPDHGALHSALSSVKEKQKYFNGRTDLKARYKETHFAEFKKNRDAIVGKAWVDSFLVSSAVFRCVQPEVGGILGARLFLDRLRVMYGYEVLSELKERFTHGYLGNKPRIAEFSPVDSWKDAHQCLQLCDLLTGAVYRKLRIATGEIGETLTDDGKNAAAVALGRKGGMARAKSISKLKRVRIAKQAAASRWNQTRRKSKSTT